MLGLLSNTNQVDSLSKEEKELREHLNKIWELTRMNKGLRDGERRSILQNLKEIDFLWSIGK